MFVSTGEGKRGAQENLPLNRLLDDSKPKGFEGRAAALRSVCDTVGLLREGYFERKKERWLKKGIVTRAAIDELIVRRNRAREEKNWEEADRIRNDLQLKGIVIEDTPASTVWKVK